MVEDTTLGKRYDFHPKHDSGTSLPLDISLLVKANNQPP